MFSFCAMICGCFFLPARSSRTHNNTKRSFAAITRSIGPSQDLRERESKAPFFSDGRKKYQNCSSAQHKKDVRQKVKKKEKAFFEFFSSSSFFPRVPRKISKISRHGWRSLAHLFLHPIKPNLLFTNSQTKDILL